MRLTPRDFAQLVEAATQAIFVRDPDDKIQFWNRGAEELYGWRTEEALGRVSHELFHTRFPEPLERIREQLQATGEWSGELVHRRKDGARIVVASHWTLQRDSRGRPQSVIEAGTDVTPRYESRKLLRESEDRFRLLVENVKEYAIYLVDIEGRVSSWNEGARRIKGYRAEEVLGKPFSIFFTPEDNAAGRPAEELRIAARQGRFEAESWRVRKNGERFWAGVVVSPVYDGLGRHVGFAKVTRDLSERKEAEERIDRLLDDLRRSNQDLEQFAFFASHDLKEPLRKISIYTEFLRSGYRGRLDAEADRLIDSILSACGRMRELIAKILDYSRLGRRESLMEPVDLKVCVSEALNELEPAIRATRARIEVEALPAVKARPMDVTRLFVNLIGNALKFVDGHSPKVRIFAEPAGRLWRVAVRDSGIGIDARYIDEIFQPFKRLHHRGKYEGSGLGLAISRRIVELHGGHIWVESEPGKGSTFYFTLPAADESSSGS